MFKSLLTSLEIKITRNLFVKIIKSVIYFHSKYRNNEIASVVIKVATLDPRFKALKFFAAEEKAQCGKN